MVSTASGLQRARRAREAFLAGEPPAESVPPAIRHSWLRSADLQVRPDLADVPQVTQAELDDQLLVSVAPVLESFAERLADTGVGLLLADTSARILRRWSGDWRVRRFFERVQTQRGSQLSEPNVGTNGVGTALAAGTLVHVRGPEHVIDLYQRAVCTGAPVRDPVSGRTIGAVTLSCEITPHSRLLVPLLESVVGELEAELLDRVTPRERQLLDAFLRLTHRVPDPVVALAAGTTITTTTASRLLTPGDLARLGELARRATRDGRTGELAITLSGDRSAVVRCEPVGDGPPVGYLVALSVAPAAMPPGIDTASARGRPLGLPGLVGSSAAWRAVVAEAERYRWSGVPLLVSGEPGVGKTAVAAAIHVRAADAGLVEVLDAALEAADGTSDWLARLRQAVSRPGAVTVVRHLDALSPTAAQAACGIVDTLGRDGRLTGTVRRPPAGGHDPLLDRFGVAMLAVPPLRERLSDLPALLGALVRRHGGPDRVLTFSAEAAEAMRRHDWPGNVRQLENLVRRLVAARTPSPVGLAELPAEIGAAAVGRRLSPLEQLELQAIRTALRGAEGNRAKAAASLGISRATLYRRLRLHGPLA